MTLPLYVVDSNVIVKWFTPERWSLEAVRLLEQSNQFVGPDFMPIEVMNVMLRKHRITEVEETDVWRTYNEVIDAFELVASGPLLERAVRLGLDYQRGAYDSVYAVLALDRACRFVTADGALYRSLLPHYPGTMLWVEDIPEAV